MSIPVIHVLLPIDAAKVAGLAFALKAHELENRSGNQADEAAGRTRMQFPVLDLAEYFVQRRQQLLLLQTFQYFSIDKRQFVGGKRGLAIRAETGDGGFSGAEQIADVLFETRATKQMTLVARNALRDRDVVAETTATSKPGDADSAQTLAEVASRLAFRISAFWKGSVFRFQTIIFGC